MDLVKVRKRFDEYVKEYDMSIKEISLKYYHSYEVAKLMVNLADRLDLNKEEKDLCYIIGLLHDIGRFEQYRKYHTLNDSKSSDHADESCIYLFDEGHIRDFIDEEKFDNTIKTAIKNHNKIVIDNSVVDEKELFFAKMIRDCDKIDIYRVYSVYMNHKFNASEVSEEVLRMFKDEEVIKLDMRKTKSDAVLIVMAFVFDIYFDESYDLLVETDNFDLYISSVEVDKDSEKLWKKIREFCFDKINRGVDE